MSGRPKRKAAQKPINYFEAVLPDDDLSFDSAPPEHEEDHEISEQEGVVIEEDEGVSEVEEMLAEEPRKKSKR